MDEFIAKANIDLFRARLAEALSPAERQTLERLLAEEERKLARAQAQPKSKRKDRWILACPPAVSHLDSAQIIAADDVARMRAKESPR